MVMGEMVRAQETPGRAAPRSTSALGHQDESKAQLGSHPRSVKYADAQAPPPEVLMSLACGGAQVWVSFR